MSEIKAEGLRHVYSVGTPFEKVAIDNINVTIPHGQLVGIIGHTGSGKSTFIQHLNGLLEAHAGKVYCDGQDINATKQITHDVRFKVGLVFQYPEYQLFEETVYKDIAFGPKNMKLSERRSTGTSGRPRPFVGLSESFLSARRWSSPAARSAASPSRAS
jgi:energy-coupling factor transport system ATP-binding protein